MEATWVARPDHIEEAPVLRLLAQAPPVRVGPNPTGMPGAALIQQILGWLSQVALWGALASILVGAAVYGLGQSTGTYANSSRGKQLVVAGAIGAILAGLAPTAVNMLFSAANH